MISYDLKLLLYSCLFLLVKGDSQNSNFMIQRSLWVFTARTIMLNLTFLSPRKWRHFLKWKLIYNCIQLGFGLKQTSPGGSKRCFSHLNWNTYEGAYKVMPIWVALRWIVLLSVCIHVQPLNKKIKNKTWMTSSIIMDSKLLLMTYVTTQCGFFPECPSFERVVVCAWGGVRTTWPCTVRASRA